MEPQPQPALEPEPVPEVELVQPASTRRPPSPQPQPPPAPDAAAGRGEPSDIEVVDLEEMRRETNRLKLELDLYKSLIQRCACSPDSLRLRVAAEAGRMCIRSRIRQDKSPHVKCNHICILVLVHVTCLRARRFWSGSPEAEQQLCSMLGMPFCLHAALESRVTHACVMSYWKVTPPLQVVVIVHVIQTLFHVFAAI